MNEFVDFWTGQGPWGFIRIFWFYFIFEFPRYVLSNYIIVGIYGFKNAFVKNRYKEERDVLWSEEPFVSIIVPGKNEGKNYHQIVKTLQEQTYQNFELIIVDDGSTDNSPTVGRALEKKGMIDLFLRNEQRGGKASASNLALRHANGKFIVHMDADCSFNRDAIENILLPFYTDEKVGAVSGNLEVRNDTENLCTLLQAIEYLKSIFIGRMFSSSLNMLNIISGAFGAFRTEVIHKIGGWDVGPGEDSDITLKVRKIGYKIGFAPWATALTDVPNTFRKLTNQRNRWARSLVRFQLRRHYSFFVPNMNARIRDIVSATENVFFSIVINIFWFFYVFDIVFNYTDRLLYVALMVFIVYSISKFVEFIPILILTRQKRQKLKYLPYMPAMVLYTGYFRRFVRSLAYIKEFLWKESYQDSFNPRKSSQQAKELGKEIDLN